MKNLIVIEGNEKYQFDNIEELIELFISKDYFNFSKEEKKKVLEKKTIANTMMDNINVVEIERYPEDYKEDAFILCDDITYILSLIKFDKIMLLEKVDADIFGKYLDKGWMQDNYIIINTFVEEILNKYLGEKYNG